MQFALMTEPQVGGTYDNLMRLARWADSADLDAFARSDHYMNRSESAPSTDAFATAAGLARDTDRVRLVILVSPITFRHPAVIAKTAATIDEMSGGRLDLGIGTGWMREEHDALGIEFPERRDRFSMTYEALAYLSAAFGRGTDGYRGRHFELAGVPVLPRPTGPLPLIVGGSGRHKTPLMAGRFADEFNVSGRTVGEMGTRIDTMRKAALEAGRDPDAILVSVMTSAMMGEDEPEYRERLAGTAARLGEKPAALEARLRDGRTLIGTPDEARSILDRLRSMGVRRIYVQEFKPLEAIETDYLDRVFSILRS